MTHTKGDYFFLIRILTISYGIFTSADMQVNNHSNLSAQKLHKADVSAIHFTYSGQELNPNFSLRYFLKASFSILFAHLACLQTLSLLLSVVRKSQVSKASQAKDQTDQQTNQTQHTDRYTVQIRSSFTFTKW